MKYYENRGFSVRMEGLEPPRLAAPDPKSGAATNYATSGCISFLTFPSNRNWFSRKKERKSIDNFGIKEVCFDHCLSIEV